MISFSIKRIKDKYLSEGKLLNEDRSSISLFMEDMLGYFLQFVVTVEEGLEAKYDNPGDLAILNERKEEMLKAMAKAQEGSDYEECLSCQ